MVGFVYGRLCMVGFTACSVPLRPNVFWAICSTLGEDQQAYYSSRTLFFTLLPGVSEKRREQLRGILWIFSQQASKATLGSKSLKLSQSAGNKWSIRYWHAARYEENVQNPTQKQNYRMSFTRCHGLPWCPQQPRGNSETPPPSPLRVI